LSQKEKEKNMAGTSKPGIYIRYDGEEYYVGQSKNTSNREAHHSGHLLETFVAPENRHERRVIQTELIQFMDAMGVPLANIHQRKEPRVGIELDEEYG
jgi:hypothetical protein